ncbi:hypothetical protein OIDMADRAFT_17965 [Oidiodendron maius Zn]|uniref:Uncharacterized protein n=1 Tax=Oidiodendron maius (strain Zn) TaxID=913774 RepID=A0A0C3HMX9_OIDMZ|nr:hypothetical protein OIDMADRAFT_17965 [Oidiodendron maius Zn]
MDIGANLDSYLTNTSYVCYRLGGPPSTATNPASKFLDPVEGGFWNGSVPRLIKCFVDTRLFLRPITSYQKNPIPHDSGAQFEFSVFSRGA